MPDFDAHAYARAVDLFTSAKNARDSLPSIKEQIRDSDDMLSSVYIDGMPKQSSAGNVQEAKLIAHLGLLDVLEKRKRVYEQVLTDAELVIENMEEFEDGNGSDAAFLRYHYMQGYSQERACEKAGHAPSYYKEKNSIALVHASYAIKRLGL